MALRKRGALEGESALYEPCQHLQEYRAKNGGAKAFRLLQGGIISRKEGKELLGCAVCRRVCGRLYSCLICANVACWAPSSPRELPHALAHARTHLDHTLAIDLHRAELFCCVCADQVYDSDFDHAVICSQSMLFKHRPKRLNHRRNIELHNGPETRSKKKKQQLSCTPGEATPHQQVLPLKHVSQANGGLPLPCGLRGLNNLGNTCFMNCILQALLHTRPLQNYFLNGGHKHSVCQARGSQRCLGCQMYNIYAAAFTGDRTPYSPAEFLYSWWQHAANLAGYKQQDAHEFFISAIDGLHANLANAARPQKSKSAGDGDCECIVHQAFAGLLRSDVACTVCGFSSTTHDPCIDISLDLEPPSTHSDVNLSNGHGGRSARGCQVASGGTTSTLYGCLDRFTRLERLGSGEKFYCQNCKLPQDSVKQMSVRKLPLVLCLHIKRFEHSSLCNVLRKVDRYVQFPFTLNMAAFLSSSVVRSRHGNRLVCQDSDRDESALSSADFELLAVVTHSGKLDSGHYITYLQLGGVWYRCDDSWISKASEDLVRACQAYMLFYVQKTLLHQESDE